MSEIDEIKQDIQTMKSELNEINTTLSKLDGQVKQAAKLLEVGDIGIFSKDMITRVNSDTRYINIHVSDKDLEPFPSTSMMCNCFIFGLDQKNRKRWGDRLFPWSEPIIDGVVRIDTDFLRQKLREYYPSNLDYFGHYVIMFAIKDVYSHLHFYLADS